MKFVFSFLKQKSKLNLINFNKSLLYKFGISLSYIKKISGKSKILEGKGHIQLGKIIYLKDKKILFTGEFINRKKCGKGREYDPYFENKLSFEGCYLNNKKHGIGIEYYTDTDNDNFNIKSEGEYLYGAKHGNFKEYYTNGKIQFEGKYLNNKKWEGIGYGKNGKIDYEIKDGIGTICKYDFEENIKFKGDYINGEIKGNGYEYDSNILIFEGNYINGKKNGKGIEYYFNNNILFEGEYKDDKIWSGVGYYILGNYEFEIKNGKGKIKEYNNDGILEYDGEYLNGERNGQGKEYNIDGVLIYEGEYIKNKYNGKGKLYDDFHDIYYMGEFKNGKKQGNGKEYKNNELIFSGMFLKGKRIYGKEYYNGKLIYKGGYTKGIILFK